LAKTKAPHSKSPTSRPAAHDLRRTCLRLKFVAKFIDSHERTAASSSPGRRPTQSQDESQPPQPTAPNREAKILPEAQHRFHVPALPGSKSTLASSSRLSAGVSSIWTEIRSPLSPNVLAVQSQPAAPSASVWHSIHLTHHQRPVFKPAQQRTVRCRTQRPRPVVLLRIRVRGSAGSHCITS